MQAQGIVETFSAKTTAKSGAPLKSPLFSFKLNGEWYGCGFKNPEIKEGDNIAFSYEEGQWGKECNVNSITKGAAQAAEAGTGSVARPDARQESIVYQSSRKDAINVLALAAERELIKLPKSGGYDALLGMVDDLTLDFARKAIKPDLSAEAVVAFDVVNDE